MSLTSSEGSRNSCRYSSLLRYNAFCKSEINAALRIMHKKIIVKIFTVFPSTLSSNILSNRKKIKTLIVTKNLQNAYIF